MNFRLPFASPSLFLLIITATRADEPASAPLLTLAPVVVTASPLGRTLFEQAQPVSVLDGEKLRLALEPTLGETLSKTPGVRSSCFGPGASRPVIRGLDADRIRILQNGVNTIDASSTSADHAVSFDPVSVDSIEVVRGPATLLYGANAIGGVVNVIDNRIPDERIDVPVRGSVGTRYSSADSGFAGDAVLEGGAGGFAWHLEGSRRETDDLRVPGHARSARLRARQPLEDGAREESGRLANTAMDTRGFSAGGSFIWDSGYAGAAFSGFDTDYGSAAEKEVTIDLRQRRWDLQGAFNTPAGGIKSVNYRFALSDYQHTEFEGAQPGTTFTNDGWDGRVEVAHEKIGPIEGALGLQAGRSDFAALGEEKFLPRVLTESRSVFLFEELSLTDSLKLQGGIRYDHITLDADADPAFGPARSRTFDDVSGSLGFVYSLGADWSLALSASFSQRAPTGQELFARGPHIATGVYEIGDDSLSAEQALGFDLSLRKRTGRLTGSATVYYNRFPHFIGQFPTGAVHAEEDESFPVFAYRDTEAEFYGGEIEATLHLLQPASTGDTLDLELKADVVHARDINTGAPLPRISPFHASAALDFRHGPAGARLEGVYSARQDRVADGELPTDGYFLLNAALTCTIHTGSITTDIYLKGVNLTNEEAREHTSFLKDIAPLGGRGIIAGVKLTF